MAKDARDGFLAWLHIGDLHITDADQENFPDFEKLIGDINATFRQGISFVLLPGDNADNGTAEQYRLVKRVVDRLMLPVEIIPGDHDFEPGNLADYFDVLAAKALPRGMTIQGYRCLFLDLVSAGTGGPDFKLGSTQSAWLEQELANAGRQDHQALIFMHTYPADLGEEAEGILALLHKHDVAVVDMGHTHYNELANDGRIVYMATRSTGQIEEGPVGFSVSAIDDGHVSWRFRESSHTRPFVLITSPSDDRLSRDATADGQQSKSRLTVNAIVWSAATIAHVDCRIGNGAWRPMQPLDGNRWTVQVDHPYPGGTIEVCACDRDGAIDSMTIQTSFDRSGRPRRHANGSDADHIGAWAEVGLCGTQLGPNRNGRKW